MFKLSTQQQVLFNSQILRLSDLFKLKLQKSYFVIFEATILA